MKRGKKYRAAIEKTERGKGYMLEEAVSLLKEVGVAKFDETVELSANLGVDPRHADQQVRGTVVLPHGTGRKVRLLVLARGEKEKEAQEAGADFVGADEHIPKLREGWMDVDVIIATPDLMSEVGKLGRILGPKGLMPNPKSGTVTFDVAKAVKDVKAGKIEYRVDKGANLHVPVGKISFEEEKLLENIKVLITEILRAKPAASKGRYIKSISLCPTMGPSIRLDAQQVINALR
ncbi:MAG: 50S ribosomal protein L1 [Candidatus Latescibacteria bacterium]|nr:50S ribosomal protein L1 [Candidatus Latescibacterota bacterium]NIM21566.1 50S ribosomal protein L1 [Candidatus Latescibacterota bacterium]NIM65833.1 50S ribosomal protein L1 [Candidatus Latescibacterota bacterium]NIO02365.1 50S ribosomal protein L1 [Candidatus Latescibacterota bacterium]NIO29227.1 50S ribosomal protein L1 [Candidatus Latescibacterota bacterium]